MSDIIVNEKDSDVFAAMTGDKLKGGFSSNDYHSDEALAKHVNRELGAKPLITEACESFIEEIKAEKREDVDLIMADLRVNDFGMLVKKDGSEIAEGLDYLKTRPQAWQQLTRQAPDKVHRHLKSNVNSWLHRKQATLVGRTFKPAEDTRDLFSLVSQRYAVHDADEIAAEIALRMPEGARGDIQYQGDGGRFEINAALGRPFDIDGDIHQIIISTRSADNGTLGQSVFFKAHRLKCTNGIYVAQKALISNTRHMGDRNTLREQFSKGLAMAADAMESFKTLWSNARAAKFLCARTGETLNGPEALARLAVHKLLAVPHIRPKSLLERLNGAWEKEPGDSVADVINAATRTAHESLDDFRSKWFGNDLEEQSGVLLTRSQSSLELAPLTDEQRAKLGLDIN